MPDNETETDDRMTPVMQYRPEDHPMRLTFSSVTDPADECDGDEGLGHANEQVPRV